MDTLLTKANGHTIDKGDDKIAVAWFHFAMSDCSSTESESDHIQNDEP